MLLKASSESGEETQGANVEGEELDKEEINEDDEGNELYREVNVNPDRSTKSSSLSSGFVSNVKPIRYNY
ncbi:hypothetical protein Tco_0230965 [Tanacetum coccineum]